MNIRLLSCGYPKQSEDNAKSDDETAFLLEWPNLVWFEEKRFM